MVQLASRPSPPETAGSVGSVSSSSQPRTPGVVRLPKPQVAAPERRKQLLVIGGLALAATAVLVALGSAALGRAGRSSQPSIVERALPVANPRSTLSAATPSASEASAVAPSTPSTPSALTVPSTNAPAPPTTFAGMVIHAAGSLRNPGVYLMPAGSRAADVVFAAGGLGADADPDRINLALPVSDGARLYVPRKGVPVPLVNPDFVIGGESAQQDVAPSAGVPTTVGTVDLNTATHEQFDSLPGVGPATAAAIVEHRTKIGQFTSLTQLMDVPGIGEAKLAAMRKRLVVNK